VIDPNLLASQDFIAIRAALVSALGNDMNRAGVLTRIFWRASEVSRYSHEADGIWWWRVTYTQFSEETGLTESQVRRVVKWLVDQGHVETREFRFNGITDRTLSFRVITSMTIPTDGATESTDGVTESSPQGVTESSPLPSIKTEDTLVSDLFENFWEVYPRRIAKEPARKAWKTAIKTVDPEVIISSAGRYATSVANSEPRFIAHPSTWLNGKRWEDDAEQQVDTAPVSPTKGMTAEERRAYHEAAAAAERKRVEELSRNARPYLSGPPRGQ